MPAIRSKIDPNSEQAQANAAHMHALVADLRAQVARAALGGGERARQKHLARDKLLPRERIEALLDPGSPFLEFSSLAAYGLYDDAAPCAGIITGIGQVHGQRSAGGRQ